MTSSYQKLITAIRSKQWHDANQTFTDIMEQKVAAHLAEERQHLNEDGDGITSCLNCGLYRKLNKDGFCDHCAVVDECGPNCKKK